MYSISLQHIFSAIEADQFYIISLYNCMSCMILITIITLNCCWNMQSLLIYTCTVQVVQYV